MFVRRLLSQDALRVAEIHCAAIKEGFLSSLGVDFLQKVYAVLAKSSSAFGFVYEINGKVEGFICGGANTKVFFKELIFKNGLFLARPLLKHLFSFATIKNIYENLFYAQKTGSNLPPAEIMSVAISDQMQGQGVGKVLMEQAVNEFKVRNIYEIKALTDEKNRASNKYYQQAGFLLVNRLKHHGHYLNVYVLKC
jgi:ribosomal protein S18 acetylase RimI-like enzyme